MSTALLQWILLLFCLPIHAKDLAKQYSVTPSNWPKVETADQRKVPPLTPLTLLKAAPSKDATALGSRLFHDPILSLDKTVSCATCHDANQTFADGLGQAIGIDKQQGRRNTPAIFGLDHWETFFWDGRAKTAEQQALMPIEDPKEMGLPLKQAIARLNAHADYPKQFKQIYGQETITTETLAKALVAFERSIPAPQTLFTQFINTAFKNPEQAVALLSPQQLQGLHVFRTKGKCMTCHNGALMSDNQFHVTGFHYYGRELEDIGRYKVTKKAEDSGAFRTPSLIGMSQTAPWMHDGLQVSLEGLVLQYNAGGPRPRPRKEFVNDPLFPKTTDLLLKLGLNQQEREALMEFLRIL
ncbi:MAG: cytochrome c peroxidase [Pseudomonadota bacterium]